VFASAWSFCSSTIRTPFFAKVLESQKAWAQRVVPYRRCCHPPYEFAADYYCKGANPYKIVKP
jgi:hypothetical protein